MECTDEEWKHCRVEKMGCRGCYYDDSILKEAIERCEAIVKVNKDFLSNVETQYINQKEIKAIETVLQALEDTQKNYELSIKQNISYKQNIYDLKRNSISKKKIEKLIDDLYGDDNTIYGTIRIIEMLKELLED